MGIRGIKARYGGNSKQALNRAIRAELVGGEDVLDALGLLSRAVLRLEEHGLPAAKARQAEAALVAVRDEMADQILRANVKQ